MAGTKTFPWIDIPIPQNLLNHQGHPYFAKQCFGSIMEFMSAQQHGSVYWKDGSSILLSSPDSKKPLVEQLGDAFSIKELPIWMDCSTTEQCRVIEKVVGGALELSKLTGRYTSIYHTDGAGMNLMDIKSRDWSKTALQATAPDLEKKHGKLAPAFAVAGFLSRYYCERYQFTKNCLVVQWSGDNPNSLADDRRLFDSEAFIHV